MPDTSDQHSPASAQPTDSADTAPLNGQVLEPPCLTKAGNPLPYSKRDPDALTIKQLHFANAVIQGKSLSDAYKIAYDTDKMNPKTIYTRGYQLRHNNDKVSAFIEAAVAKITSKINVDKSYVLEALHHSAETALARRTMRLKKVVNGEVVEIEAHFPDRGAANRALELLGKEAGMFVDRREVGAPGDFARLEDAQLDALIAEYESALKGE